MADAVRRNPQKLEALRIRRNAETTQKHCELAEISIRSCEQLTATVTTEKLFQGRNILAQGGMRALCLGKPAGAQQKSLVFGLVAVLASALAACEAPLDMSEVDKTLEQDIRRTDMFQAAIATEKGAMVVGMAGVVVDFESGAPVSRTELAYGDKIIAPQLISVDTCPDGSTVILDAHHYVWVSEKGSDDWAAKPIDTFEDITDLDCAPDGSYWITASYETLYSSKDKGDTWEENSLGDDLVLAFVEFVDQDFGVAFGEFGAVLTTIDGGATWTASDVTLPGGIFPLGAYVASRDNWWVGGLDGVIVSTKDGGQTWQREDTGTSTPVFTIASAGDSRLAFGEFGTVLVQTGDSRSWAPHAQSQEVMGYLRAAIATTDGVLVAGGAGSVLHISPSDYSSVKQ